MKNLTDFHKMVETGVDPRLFIVARGNPQPLPLNNSPEWKKRICPISSHHYLTKVGNTSLKESLTSSITSI